MDQAYVYISLGKRQKSLFKGHKKISLQPSMGSTSSLTNRLWMAWKPTRGMQCTSPIIRRISLICWIQSIFLTHQPIQESCNWLWGTYRTQEPWNNTLCCSLKQERVYSVSGIPTPHLISVSKANEKSTLVFKKHVTKAHHLLLKRQDYPWNFSYLSHTPYTTIFSLSLSKPP